MITIYETAILRVGIFNLKLGSPVLWDYTEWLQSKYVCHVVLSPAGMIDIFVYPIVSQQENFD